MLTLFVLVFSLNVVAEEAPFRVFETESLSIKLSNDGTGIVKDIHCGGCDFNYVKITPASKASINGKEVSIMQARERAGKFVMVSFNPETQEVQYIRWSE
ncbi:MAG: hypothetical protein KJN89_06510 [Gammaproteobacteria bacterium]|nr:hypothetical protein [Gammaproteobacteria bacterium]